MAKIFLGMSGGVDSSLAAALLQEAGHDVTGVYMKNWSVDLPGMQCPWAEDLADAKRVATHLGIDFQVFDFEEEYRHKVVDHMLAEFKAGRTPNPDIMCNQEIKFKLFFEKALAAGADLIATGHYARVANQFTDLAQPADYPRLLAATDANKDQTYFLYRMPAAALARTLFPLGDLTKPEVKQQAAARSLHNAQKKESMGVCFVGEVGMQDFLREYFDPQPGPIVDQESGAQIGTHTGVIFYTIGQRHGLYLGGGLPYYVVKKDLENNILYVSRNLNAADLWAQELNLTDLLWRPAAAPQDLLGSTGELSVRLRHRAPLIPARLEGDRLVFAKPIKRPAAGQSAVFYCNGECLGGGIVADP